MFCRSGNLDKRQATCGNTRKMPTVHLGCSKLVSAHKQEIVALAVYICLTFHYQIKSRTKYNFCLEINMTRIPRKTLKVKSPFFEILLPSIYKVLVTLNSTACSLLKCTPVLHKAQAVT